jgi:hypothetical protein
MQEIGDIQFLPDGLAVTTQGVKLQRKVYFTRT